MPGRGLNLHPRAPKMPDPSRNSRFAFCKCRILEFPGSLVVKDSALSLLCLGLQLWHGFNPCSRSFYVHWKKIIKNKIKCWILVLHYRLILLDSFSGWGPNNLYFFKSRERVDPFAYYNVTQLIYFSNTSLWLQIAFK